MLPTVPSGSPPASFFQVSPPSAERQIPPSGPPDSSVQGLRYTCQNAAKRIRGLLGSMERSEAPVLSLTKRILSQVFPPSFDRKMPRSELLPHTCPCAAT